MASVGRDVVGIRATWGKGPSNLQLNSMDRRTLQGHRVPFDWFEPRFVAGVRRVSVAAAARRVQTVLDRCMRAHAVLGKRPVMQDETDGRREQSTSPSGAAPLLFVSYVLVGALTPGRVTVDQGTT
jgi:hypothetical protein